MESAPSRPVDDPRPPPKRGMPAGVDSAAGGPQSPAGTAARGGRWQGGHAVIELNCPHCGEQENLRGRRAGNDLTIICATCDVRRATCDMRDVRRAAPAGPATAPRDVPPAGGRTWSTGPWPSCRRPGATPSPWSAPAPRSYAQCATPTPRPLSGDRQRRRRTHRIRPGGAAPPRRRPGSHSPRPIGGGVGTALDPCGHRRTGASPHRRQPHHTARGSPHQRRPPRGARRTGTAPPTASRSARSVSCGRQCPTFLSRHEPHGLSPGTTSCARQRGGTPSVCPTSRRRGGPRSD